MNRQPLNFPIAGTQERTSEVNDQLKRDMAIYATRAFLDKYEKSNFELYYQRWVRNHIIALFTFDRNGNYLPNLYSAPKDYLRMLYPIDDIMNYDRQGTLIIDREQYSPELRNLSFFIYIVDEELYEQYATAQHFNGKTKPTYMFDQAAGNGVRVFKDYYALANHLRQSRLVTYCLGPRATFYLRYLIYQIHVHITDDAYAYGERQDPTLVNDVIDSIKRHLAFNVTEKLDYEVNITEDKYAEYRKLKEALAAYMDLPDAKHFHNKTDIIRYRKQSFSGAPFYHAKKSKVSKYADLGYRDWHNVMFTHDMAIFFVWDTRTIDNIVSIDKIDKNDFMQVKDNRNDLVCRNYASNEVRQICEWLRLEVPIQMRDGEMIVSK